MRRGLALLIFAASASLVGCGGGDESAPVVSTSPTISTPTPPVAPLAPAQPAIEVSTPGGFYRDPSQVLEGQPLTFTATGVTGTVTWRLLEAPGRFIPIPHPLGSGRTAILPVLPPGAYTVEMTAPEGTLQRSFHALPSQIEYVVDVEHRATGNTVVTVRPGDDNAPMTDCLVFTAAGCRAPESVTVSLDGSLKQRLTTSNAITADGKRAFLVDLGPTAALGSGTHGLQVVVVDGTTGRIFNGARSRESYLVFDATKNAQLKAFGVLTAEIVPTMYLHGSPALIPDPRIGNTFHVAATAAGTSFTAYDASSFRVVEKPPGSTATLQPRNWSTFEVGFSVTVDVPGRYTFEATPRLPDGSTATPVYLTLNISPHDLFFTAFATSDSPSHAAAGIRQSPENMRLGVVVLVDSRTTNSAEPTTSAAPLSPPASSASRDAMESPPFFFSSL